MPREETTDESLKRIHRQVSPSMGQLAIAIERRKVRIQQLRLWAETLQRGAADLYVMANRMERPKL